MKLWNITFYSYFLIFETISNSYPIFFLPENFYAPWTYSEQFLELSKTSISTYIFLS